jgi:hypothetical protein
MAHEARKIYTDRTEVEAIVAKMNAERKRDNFEYVVGNNYDWNDGGKLTGYYVGVVSND